MVVDGVGGGGEEWGQELMRPACGIGSMNVLKSWCCNTASVALTVARVQHFALTMQNWNT